jgi:hypothetical protein
MTPLEAPHRLVPGHGIGVDTGPPSESRDGDMSVQLTRPAAVLDVPGAPPTTHAGVIKEAKRRRRRRRAVPAAVIALVGLGAWLAVFGQRGPELARPYPRATAPAVLVLDPNYYAFGPHHLIYADELPGDAGFEAHQQLVSVRNTHISLLWQERNAGDRDSFSPR